MTQIIITFMLFLTAGGIFFGFTDAEYRKVEALKAEKVELDKAADKMRELNEVRDGILQKRAAISRDDIEHLEKALPDNVDNVKLVNDLNGIADEYGMTVRKAEVIFETDTSGDIVVEGKKYGTVSVAFTVTGSYQTFLNFLNKLEHSLRIVDVTDISFSAGDEDVNEYRIELKTYWLNSSSS
jgi:Tfp pilus assembly protein PilO